MVIITIIWSNKLFKPTWHSDVYLRTICVGRRKGETFICSLSSPIDRNLAFVLTLLHIHVIHGFMPTGLPWPPQNSSRNPQARKGEILSGGAWEKLVRTCMERQWLEKQWKGTSQFLTENVWCRLRQIRNGHRSFYFPPMEKKGSKSPLEKLPKRI